MKLSFIITSQVLLIIALSIGLYVGFGWVDRQHRDVIYAQAVAAGQLTKGAIGMATASDLVKYHQGIATVQDIVIARDDLVKVVTAIEGEAARASVAVTIPLVAEQKKVDENGVPIANSGSTFDVRLQISATGDPVKLLQFAQAVEHLPYLLTLSTFKMQTTTANQNSLVANSPDKTAPVTAASGQLEADLIITVMQPLSSPSL